MLEGRRATGIGVALAALLVLLASHGFAQTNEGCRAPLLNVQEGAVEFNRKDTIVLIVQIENPNDDHVDAVQTKLTVTHPAGWDTSLAQSDFTLSPRAVPVTSLSITAPAPGAGVPSGDVVLTSTSSCTVGNVTTSEMRSTQVVHVSLASSPAPLFILGVGVGILALTAAAFVVLRSRSPTVTLGSPDPRKAVVPGKGASFPLTVANRAGKPRTVSLRVDPLPEGWSAHLAVDQVDVEPKEERNLWLLVRSPDSAPAGAEASVTVRAIAGERAHDTASLTVRARVAGAGAKS